MELWVATTNKGKLNEFANLLAGKNIEVHSINEIDVYSPPKETGNSFVENARIKAKSLKSVKSDCWVVADDSGLEVAGLNNMPGIHSARYAGDQASDAENTTKLLKMMSLRSATHRTAHFKCCLVAISPDGQEHVFEGLLEGDIARGMKGSNGFGYDNVFIPKNEERTLAEMNPSEKNKISHRSVAIKQFLEAL